MSTQNKIFKLSSLCPETRLLICCAQTKLNEKQLILANELIEQKINWDLFTKLIFTHGLVPLVYQNLNKHFSSHLPENNKITLRHYLMASTQSNLAMLRELFNIITLLKNNGISCIPFKGLIAAQRIYGDLSARKSGDIDILVKQDDFKKAKNLFLDEGFETTLDEQAEFDYLQMGLHHKIRKISVDLHYGIPPKQADIQASKFFNESNHNSIYNNATISIGNREINTFSDTDMFLVLCVNATKEYWNQSLYRYCDIHEYIIKNEINWDLLEQRAISLNCKRMTYTALLVCHEIFDLPDKNKIVKKLNSIVEIKRVKNELLQQLFPIDVENFKSVRGQLLVLDSETEFFSSLIDTNWSKLKFNYPKLLAISLRDQTFIQLPEKYFYLYYLIKPFRVMIKKCRELY